MSKSAQILTKLKFVQQLTFSAPAKKNNQVSVLEDFFIPTKLDERQRAKHACVYCLSSTNHDPVSPEFCMKKIEGESSGCCTFFHFPPRVTRKNRQLF